MGIWNWCVSHNGIVFIGVAVVVSSVIRRVQNREFGEREIVEVCALTLALAEAVSIMKRAVEADASHEGTGSFIGGLLLFYAAARGLKSILIKEKLSLATPLVPAEAGQMLALPASAMAKEGDKI